MALYDIVGYAYNADLYCPDCILEEATGDPNTYMGRGMSAEAALDEIAIIEHIDRQDEATYDSGDFPKVVFRDMLDGEEHCGRCHTKLGE